jgi:hopanoid-associated phosphorylase
MIDTASIGIIVGMRAEAALLPPRAMIGCSGGRFNKAAQIADYMLRAGVQGIVSFGVGGGLQPGLRPGQLVVATLVDLGGAALPADPAWSRNLLDQLPHAVNGIVCGVDEAAVDVTEKAALHAETGGILVDMESGAVAEACAAAGKPFVVLRAVADPADRAIPPFALAGLGEDGRTKFLPVLLGLIGQPATLPALLGLARDSRAALTALGAAARLLGPTLGF